MQREISLNLLHWLLVPLGLAMALHLPHFPLWLTLLIAGAGIWRYLIARYGWRMPSPWLLVPLALAGAVGILASYHGMFGRDASVALLALMLALKLMETRTHRDCVLLVFSGFFLVITVFLFQQSIAMGLFMLVPVAGLTAALLGASHANGNLGWRLQAKTAAKLLAQAVPVMLALFLLFPRVPGPLWGVPQDAYRGMSGLSDSMAPGEISELSLSSAVAFRVQFAGPSPPGNRLYWRGPVLWYFDGRRWSPGSPGRSLESLSARGALTRYAVTLEPHNRNWLFALDMPAALPPDAGLSRDRQLLSQRPVRTRMRYEVASSLDYTLGAELDARARRLALQLPRQGNPHSRAMARGWAESGVEPSEIVERALRMYREQDFVYTLTPPRLGADGMDDFLFGTRRGFCEHYAGSFVYLMRAAGVPARVVTGYQGGERNPIGDYFIVRQSDAHAWAEVWLQGRGWVRVDPTAAVSPLRVEAGIGDALPHSDSLPLLARRDATWLRELYLNWDALNNGWNQWVLGYNQQRQADLWSRLTGQRPSWQALAAALMAILAVIVLALSFFLLRNKRRRLPPLQRFYQTFLRKLEKVGLQRQPGEGPQDFGQRVAAQLPAQAAAIERISAAYARLRYRDTADAKALADFKRMVTTFRIS